MGELNFCPFDFEEIDMNNLAYELVFAGRWNWERVKKETIVGDRKRRYINENDRLRDQNYREDTTADAHVILLENRAPQGESGLKLFCRFLERERKKRFSGKVSDNAKGTADYAGFEEEKYEEEEEEVGFVTVSDAKPILLNYRKKNGIDTFCDENGNDVMYAMPCCPLCHNRLPIGWDIAKDFAAVSLMAPTESGKTTFLYSMMHRQWAKFQRVRTLNEKSISIVSAHRLNDPTDTRYHEMSQFSEKMCQDKGKCPDATQREFWIPPVFLQIHYGEDLYILGIYDNAGENLKYWSTSQDNLDILLDKMFADIFLFDPKHMNIVLSKDKEEITDIEYQQYNMLEIAEQGRYQKQNYSKVISAQELLSNMQEEQMDKREKEDLLSVYLRSLSTRQQRGTAERMKKEMYFVGVIIKSDLLEKNDKVVNCKDYALLFDREYPTEAMMDWNSMVAKSKAAEELISELELFGNRELNAFRFDYGDITNNEKSTGRNSVSWHWVSALGCDAIKHDKLQGKYEPICVEEPLLTCILKFINSRTKK